MADLKPLVSIGLPAYNGERYLGEALDSLLSQTLADLEIVVSDNASTDATASIVRAYAERDARVKYHRNPSNVGAICNFNRTFELAAGKYFKWHACDDLCAPTYLEKCVATLEEDPSAVLCQSRTVLIDDMGRALSLDAELQLSLDRQGIFANPPDPHFADSDDPVIRFSEALPYTRTCQHVMGVMRADAMRATGLLAMYYGSDRAFLIRMALRGRFREVPEALFFNRVHKGNSRSLARARERYVWGGAPAWISAFHLLNGYLDIGRSVLQADMSLGSKMRCLGFAARRAVGARIGRPRGAQTDRSSQSDRISSAPERRVSRRIDGPKLGDRTQGTGI